MPKRTPLYNEHKKLGAKIIEFAEWEMPVSYSGIIEEHNAVRNSAGLFDISHMGIMTISGKGALELIQKLTTNDASKLADFKAQYSIVCNEGGGAVDDVLVYKLPEEYMVIVNAANAEKDLQWFNAHATEKTSINLEYGKKAMLSLQGPKAELILLDICDINVENFKHNQCVRASISGSNCLVSRTGYTGEDGFEFIMGSQDAEKLWQVLQEKGSSQGLMPCGLGARDSLRLESGLPLYGHEYNEKIGPIEAGYGWAVKFEKGAFIGKEALLKHKESAKQKLVGIKIKEKGIPRQGYSVFKNTSLKERVGEITSGTFSPSLGCGIGLAYLKKDYTIKGLEAFVEIRGKGVAAEVSSLPFYPHKYKK